MGDWTPPEVTSQEPSWTPPEAADHNAADFTGNEDPELAAAKAEAGGAEAVANQVTGAAGQVAGGAAFLGKSLAHGMGALLAYGVGGDPKAVTERLSKQHDEDRRTFDDVSNFLTYTPRSEQGKALADFPGEVVHQLTRPTKDVLSDLGAPKAITDKIPEPGAGTEAVTDVGGDLLKMAAAAAPIAAAPKLIKAGVQKLRTSAAAATAEAPKPAAEPPVKGVSVADIQAQPDPIPQPQDGLPAPATQAVQKPHIKPKAGESAAAAAERQGITSPTSQEVPGAPASQPETTMGPTSVGAAQAAPVVREGTFAPPREEGPQYAVPTTEADREARADHLNGLDALAGGTMPGFRRGALTGDWDATGNEFQQGKIPDAPGQVMRNQFAAEQRALHDATTNTFDQLGSQARDSVDKETLEQRGGIVRGAIRGVEDHFSRLVNGLYQSARSLIGNRPMPLPQRFMSFLHDDANFIGDQQRSLQGAIKSWQQRLWSSGDPARNLPAGSVGGAERLREIINDNYHPDSAGVAKKLKNLLDQDVAEHAGGPNMFKAARDALQRKETMLEPDGVNALRRPRDRNGIANDVPLDGVMDHVTNLPREEFEHFTNVLRSAAHLGDPKLAEMAASAIREIQAHMVSRMHNAARGEGGAWSANDFYKAANRVSTNLPAAFKENPHIIQQLSTINHAGNILKMDKAYPGAVAQGAKTGLIGGIIQKGARLGATALGATHGPVGGIAGHIVGGALEKGAERVINARRGAIVRQSIVPKDEVLGATVGGGRQRGAIGNLNKLPEVAREEDQGGRRIIIHSENGRTEAGRRGNDIQVYHTVTNAKARGQGEGVARMVALADEAHANGGMLHSDTEVTDAGQKVYPALSALGYDVKRNPNVEKITNRKGEPVLNSTDTRPVFTVGPRNPQRGSVGVMPERRGPSRNVSDDEHFQLLRKMQSGQPLTAEEQKALTASIVSKPSMADNPAFQKQQGRIRVVNPNDKPAMVNIGLHQGDPANGGSVMDPKKVAAEVKRLGVRVSNASVHMSNSEPTLVLSLNRSLKNGEGDALASKLKQTAIAQRTGPGEGNMLGEGARSQEAKDQGWDKYNSDYFRMHDGRTASEHEAPYEPEGQQTVMNPQRNEYPGIYDHPSAIMSRVKVAPEDPIMHQLFGVTRKDLHDEAMRMKDAPQSFKLPGETGSPNGSKAANNVMTEHNAARLRGIIDEAKKNPEMYHGMVGWYVMRPLYDKVVETLGKTAAPAVFSRLNHLMGMASPGSNVMTEINRGTAANMMATKGKFGEFLEHAGAPMEKRSKKAPPELANVQGHPYHSTAQGSAMRKYVEGGELDMNSPKVPTYIASSAVPGQGFQNRVAVGDSHWSRGVGLADVRTDNNPHRSVSNAEITQLHPWYKSEIADKVGLPPTSAQAVQWGALSKETGVDSPVGAPKLEMFAQAVKKAATRNKVTPEEQLKRIIKGLAHAG